MTQVPRVVFTFGQVAAAVGVRRSSVAEWAADGRLVTVLIEGKVRVAALELERIQREGIPKSPIVKPRARRRGTSAPAAPGEDIRKLRI